MQDKFNSNENKTDNLPPNEPLPNQNLGAKNTSKRMNLNDQSNSEELPNQALWAKKTYKTSKGISYKKPQSSEIANFFKAISMVLLLLTLKIVFGLLLLFMVGYGICQWIMHS